MKTNDTICAISTPRGVGGIAVIRLSGPDAVGIANKFCSVCEKSHQAHYSVFHAADGQIIDETVVTFFKGPHSYTGEDCVEISCHGSTYVQQAILQQLIDGGARLAEAGEFTKRAFVSGRLDLSQAEAVADLIDSTNSANHQLAIQQLRGSYSQKLAELREHFLELVSLMELELDFSDEDVEFADRSQLYHLLDQAECEIKALTESFQLGNSIKQGVPVAIVGQPNVGKSTLLNALLGDDRAIVNPTAGTTRDTIEDTMTIDGVGFRFIDTAGLRNSTDAIECAGIERSKKAAEKAQTILYVAEAANTADEIKKELESLAKDVDLSSKQRILVLNKTDIAEVPSIGIDGWLIKPISAKNGEGLDSLKSALVKPYLIDTLGEQPILTNIRHYEALKHGLESVGAIRNGLRAGIPSDLVVIDIREALYHIGTITGQISSEEILGTVFSRFCIGK